MGLYTADNLVDEKQVVIYRLLRRDLQLASAESTEYEALRWPPPHFSLTSVAGREGLMIEV
jgi:hypothetical protein